MQQRGAVKDMRMWSEGGRVGIAAAGRTNANDIENDDASDSESAAVLAPKNRPSLAV